MCFIKFEISPVDKQIPPGLANGILWQKIEGQHPALQIYSENMPLL